MGIQEISLVSKQGLKASEPVIITADLSEKNRDTSIFSKEEKVKVVIKNSKTEIDADTRTRGAKKQEEIGRHLRCEAQEKVCNASGISTTGGITAIASGIGACLAYFLSAPVSVPITLGALTVGGLITGIVGLLKTNSASREKTKANNYVRQAQHTKEETAKDIVDKASSLVEAAAHHVCGDNPYAKVSQEEIDNTIKSLGLDDTQKIIYLQKPDNDKNKNSKAVVYYTEIKQNEYDNVPDEKGVFKGVKNSLPITLDREYFDSGFLSQLLNNEELSTEEKNRFIEISKALSTNRKFKVAAKDKANPNAYHKEDVDFFDFNNDGKMNAEDLQILHNIIYQKYNNHKIIQNPDIKPLNTVAVDFNNDNIIDEKDEIIYQNSLAKADINADGKNDIVDKQILTKYLISRINLANRTGQEHNALLSSLGYKINEEDDNAEEFFLAKLKYDILKIEKEK